MQELPEELDEFLRLNPSAYRDLLQLVASSAGEIAPHIATWIRDTFDLHTVSIGEVAGDSVDRIDIKGFASRKGHEVDHYDLTHTPCLDVVANGRQCFVADSAAQKYPQDDLFTQASIRSYFGVPLVAPTGRTLGLACVFDDKPFEQPVIIQSLLSWLQVCLQEALYADRLSRFVQESGRWMSATTPEELFRKVAGQLTRAYQVTTTIITEWVGPENKEIRILAVRHLGEDLVAFEGQVLAHEKTPCKDLFVHRQKFVFGRLQEQYPEFELFEQLNVCSYLGVRIDSRDGKPLGHLAILHNRELDKELENNHNLLVLGSPIGAEIDRLKSKRQQKDFENILLARQKLESLGLMSGAIAHDFNNLLVGILGNASLALDVLDKESPVAQRIQQIEQGATRAGEIVAQLLDFAGHAERKNVPSNLSQLVQDAEQLLTFSTRNKNNLKFELGDNLPLVSVDPTLLHQVVLNLVLNAIDAIDLENGHVNIRTRLVNLDSAQIRNLLLGSELPIGDYVCLEVIDNGCGISEESMVRIFDPFYTKKENGRGLGLSIVQGIVRGHNAGLEIESMEQRGTRIAVYFAQNHSAQVTEISRVSVASIRIDKPLAVVDDEESVRAVTVALLESVGHESVGFAGGEELLEAFTAGAEFGAAIIDITMPRLDGWATLRGMRERNINIPVVMMSGYTEYESANELADRNQVVFLRKPFRSHDVVQALSEAAPEKAK